MYPYSGLKLIELLEKQHQNRSAQTDLFKTGTFNLLWRAKVGSFPHPDLETLVSAGEPCGAWKPQQGRAEDKRNVGDNWQHFPELPLYGFIPGSSIRGIVRAWAKKRPDIAPRMIELLGTQADDGTKSGKVEFLDAFPETPTKLSLDIVNPQQDFQVYHQGQGTPLSLYTLGNGDAEEIPIKVAIRGIPGRATADDVKEVWCWTRQALSLYGVGSRTASGYGVLSTSTTFRVSQDVGYASKQFEFSLYSQGNAGPNIRTMELRASHWRGWLRSWILRFLLGVMSERNAEITLGELMGTLMSLDDDNSRRGCICIQMLPGSTWGVQSNNKPNFFVWQGKLQISAPKEILNRVILPIIRFSVMLGGVGRGWRRPLHIFLMERKNRRTNDTEHIPSARGCYLSLTHQIQLKEADEKISKQYGLALKADDWTVLYQNWLTAVQNHWGERFSLQNQDLGAEVFSPNTCAVYLVPEPEKEPVAWQSQEWAITEPVEQTRGKGMELIYRLKYKRKIDVGGDAAGGGNAHCSWVSIKRVKVSKQGCQEVVCLFMGGEQPNSNHLRSHFLRDLATIPGAVHLFGVQP
jgi:CRISPR-associated protein Cmr6